MLHFGKPVLFFAAGILTAALVGNVRTPRQESEQPTAPFSFLDWMGVAPPNDNRAVPSEITPPATALPARSLARPKIAAARLLAQPLETAERLLGPPTIKYCAAGGKRILMVKYLLAGGEELKLFISGRCISLLTYTIPADNRGGQKTEDVLAALQIGHLVNELHLEIVLYGLEGQTATSVGGIVGDETFSCRLQSALDERGRLKEVALTVVRPNRSFAPAAAPPKSG